MAEKEQVVKRGVSRAFVQGVSVGVGVPGLCVCVCACVVSLGIIWCFLAESGKGLTSSDLPTGSPASAGHVTLWLQPPDCGGVSQQRGRLLTCPSHLDSSRNRGS